MQLQARSIGVVQGVEVQAFIGPRYPQSLGGLPGLFSQAQRHAFFFVQVLHVRGMRFTQQFLRLAYRDICKVALEQVYQRIVRTGPSLVQQVEQLAFTLTHLPRPLIAQCFGTLLRITCKPFAKHLTKRLLVKETHHALWQFPRQQVRPGHPQRIGW
ncbi:hypothetical protein D3C78_548260 [compost metagenome]